MQQKQLSDLQLEILKLYSTGMSEEELKELKKVLAGYFANKAIKEADGIWKMNNLSEDDMENWLNEH